MRRATLDGEFAVDASLPVFEEMTKVDLVGGIKAEKLAGIVVDDVNATLTGKWTKFSSLKGFVDLGYQVSGNGQARYDFEIPEDGNWDIRLSWQPHESRSSKTRVQVEIDGEIVAKDVVNQTKSGALEHSFHSLGKQNLTRGQKGAVIVLSEGTDKNITVDAVQVVKE